MNSNRSGMRAVVFDGKLGFAADYPIPELPEDWALIRIKKAGICQTDLELMKGYKSFKGVLGHEFIGIVEKCCALEWIGKRITGEINVACGKCPLCKKGLGNHCPDRKVLGIDKLDGCMADWCVLPVSNLFEIPENITDDRAVFIEPLSAACQIIDQVSFRGDEHVIVLGDGRLGILCAWAISTVVNDVTLFGHHPEKLDISKWRHLKSAPGPLKTENEADIVVDATGSGAGISEAMSICKPGGTIVLKSTVASKADLNLAPIVVKEINLIGSRCGRFEVGIQMLKSYPDMPLERLITENYPVEEAITAFERASMVDALKVLIEMA
ncbi:MAG TPA: alcohol dehydrogenase catalytic domain-containing protein [Desulfobacteraceae bacterium]|nr:alcohol dehydrogenase catalytic domain-containing protein [Desulfobacteraceae bacterium]HPQ27084.1 alcohol dehydrogenase catalytic domain-containing protein [Desulfobacteraceae bacterium]